MATVTLTTAAFKEKVFDYTKHQEWQYAGEGAAIVDFYADWCGPCKTIAPVLEELSEQYAGKLTIYKVDTEAEQELAQVFGIQSIPTLLFIPMVGGPSLQAGAYPKHVLEQIIDEHLLNPNPPAEDEV